MRRLVLFATVIMIPIACNSQTPKNSSSAKIVIPPLDAPEPPEPTDKGTTDKAIVVSEEKKVPEKSSEWVQLFNRNDLNGWQPHPAAPGNWEVDDGILIGHSKKDGYLFSK